MMLTAGRRGCLPPGSSPDHADPVFAATAASVMEGFASGPLPHEAPEITTAPLLPSRRTPDACGTCARDNHPARSTPRGRPYAAVAVQPRMRSDLGLMV